MADTLLGETELKKLFQSGNIPRPADFAHLIDTAEAARRALGLTTTDNVSDGLTPGKNSGLVYEGGRLKLALGTGLTLDAEGRLTFDSRTEQAIRADQSKKDSATSRADPGYVAQVMYAAVQVSQQLFSTASASLGGSKVDAASGMSFNLHTSCIEFDKPQYAFQWVRLDENAWTWNNKLGVLVTSLNPAQVKDNGKSVPLSTLKKLVQDTGALLCFGTDSAHRSNLTAETLIIALNKGELVAAGGWRLSSTTSLKVNYAKWQNYLHT